MYPVLPAGDDMRPDLAIEDVSVTQTAFEDAPVTVRAEVHCRGFAADETVVAELLDDKQKVVETLTQPVGEQNPLVFRFQTRPVRQGVLFYQLRVKAGEEQVTKEATQKNNSRLVKIERGKKPLRILYVGGRPNWEFKFLNRALADDPQLELVGLLRIAKREAKFDWRGHKGKSKNSLFRGFENEAEEAVEQYDEPVLVRVNTRTPEELKGGFPKTAKELFQFDALVIDDLEAEFFTQDQQELIQEFVSRRGGGFLMLGGPLSYRHGKYQRTPIGGLLPVKLNQAPPKEFGESYRLSLTREGWLQPWMRLRKQRTGEQTRLEEMPDYLTVNRVQNLKPGASVLATMTDNTGREFPALVTQRFGRGRSAALLVGDYWRHQLKQPEQENAGTQRKDFGKAWRQMFRWLVADVPEPVEIELVESEENDSVQLRVRVRDEKFAAQENAQVKLAVHSSGQKTPIILQTEPALDAPGVFQAEFLPRESGGYRVTADVSTLEGVTVGQAETGWVTQPQVQEFRRITLDRKALEQLAAQTGGRVLTYDELDEFAQTLPTTNVPVTEYRSDPLWHQPWFFLLALGCLVGEWGLRRWKGYP